MRKRFVTPTLILAIVTLSVPSAALGPLDLEVGAKVGAATNPFPSDPNPLGVGVGGRAGVSFLGIYGGVSALYYFGGSKAPQLGSPAEADVHSWMYGIELGYGFQLVKLVTIRPLVGLGNFSLDSTIGGTSTSARTLYVEPALVALVTLEPVFFGADAGVLVLAGFSPDQSPSKMYTAFTLHGQVGVRF
jgi:hypothetical protein